MGSGLGGGIGYSQEAAFILFLILILLLLGDN